MPDAELKEHVPGDVSGGAMLDYTPADLKFVRHIAQMVQPFERRWRRAYKSITADAVARSLFRCPKPSAFHFSRMFPFKRCHENALVACWWLNGMTFTKGPWEMVYTSMHSAVIHVSRQWIVDPTYEANKELVADDVVKVSKRILTQPGIACAAITDWREQCAIGLGYESFGQQAYGLMIGGILDRYPRAKDAHAFLSELVASRAVV